MVIAMEQEKSKSRGTVKFLCNYGGKIVPRFTDGKLRYLGGHTRVLAVDRSISFTELMVKLVEFCGSSVMLRCQLPNGDLETLISVKSEEDLMNILEEYDRASSCLRHPLKIRAILSPPKFLKTVSPPPSTAPSITSSFDSPAFSLPYLTRFPSRPASFPGSIVQSNINRMQYGVRSYSPLIGFPIAVQSNLSYIQKKP